LLYGVVGFFNGYKGSLPSEQVQNHVRGQHGWAGTGSRSRPVPSALYHAVVDGRYRRRWNAFLFAHPHWVRLEVLQVHEGDSTGIAWRLRLATSLHWRVVDAVHRAVAAQAKRTVGGPPVSSGRPPCPLLDNTESLLLTVPGHTMATQTLVQWCNGTLDEQDPVRPHGGRRTLRLRDLRNMILSDISGRFLMDEDLDVVQLRQPRPRDAGASACC
jgi:hypothetical protein